MVSGLMLTAMLGYTLSRNELPGRKIINFLVFFTLLFNGVSVNAYYLELPVMGAARFNVADNTNLVVSAGPYLAYGVAGKAKDGVESVKTFSDKGLDFKRFDAGLGVGVALEFGRIIAGLDGQFGLVDVQSFTNPKNMNFSIVVGYKF